MQNTEAFFKILQGRNENDRCFDCGKDNFLT